MALDYGARLLTDSFCDPATAIHEVIQTVAAWAKISNPLDNGPQPSRRERTTVYTEVLGVADSDEWAWRLRLTNPDNKDPAVVWSVVVVVHRARRVEVSIRLDRVRTDGAIVRRIEEPAPPRCVADLLDHPGLVFADGGRALSTGVWVVNRDDAPDLARLIRDPDRRLPVFAFTPRDDDPIDGGVLLPKVLGIAHVVLIKSSASWELDKLLPRRLNVYGGAARLWWPGVTDRSNRFDHQLWTASDSARRLAGTAADVIVEAARTASVGSRRVAELERAERDSRTVEMVRELEDLRRKADEANAIARTDQGSSPDAASSRQEVRGATDRLVEQLREDVSTALAIAQEHQDEADAARERASVAERYRDQLRIEVAELRKSATGDLDEDEDEAALRAEIEAELAGYGDVEGARPRTFTFGHSFCTSVEVLGPKYRNKVVKACADVASGSPNLLSRREDHHLRQGAGPGEDQLLRTSDGAGARRCYIENKTASARRLHYWNFAEAIEFASVNVHDDMTIPE